MNKVISLLFILIISLGLTVMYAENFVGETKGEIARTSTPTLTFTSTVTPTATIDLNKIKFDKIDITPTKTVIVDTNIGVNAFSLEQIADKGISLTKIKKDKIYIWKEKDIEEVKEYVSGATR